MNIKTAEFLSATSCLSPIALAIVLEDQRFPLSIVRMAIVI